jgi:homoserine dehydrogenase
MLLSWYLADILEDASIDCVLELMGGTTFAKDVIFGAIAKGKHVITANKALIAAHMDELIALLAANPTVKFMYEAAVGGGIPIIHTMRSTFVPDSITNIAGMAPPRPSLTSATHLSWSPAPD